MRFAPAATAASELATPMREVVVAVEADLGLGLAATRAHGADARRHVVGQHVAGRVDDVDALGAVVVHEHAPARQLLAARAMCAIIRKPTVSRPSSRARPKCWSETSASVQCVATRTMGTPLSWAMLQVVDGADAREAAARRPWRASCAGSTAPQVLLVGVRREAVVDRGAAQAVAVRDLDDRHAGGVEARWRRATICSSRIWWRFGCMPSRSDMSCSVTRGPSGSCMASPCAGLHRLAAISSAIISPVRSAAAVMMSRLPAYGGR